ncbi:MAG: hypothetical protein II103_06375, partial [Treponema sp.]|nr:hypothetical protein [Treponema sp.]
ELQSDSAIHKKSMEGFFVETYAAMEGPAKGGLRSNGGVGPPEPRNGGDEMKRSVELANKQNRRANKMPVLKTTVKKNQEPSRPL